MSLQIALFHYFILFYGWVTFHCIIYIIDTTSLSIHLSMDMWVASVSWLLWCNELPGACAVCAKSCPTLCNPVAYSMRFLFPWDFPGENTGVRCHALLQGIFPTQGSNAGLLHCRQILYCLSHAWFSPDTYLEAGLLGLTVALFLVF